MASLILIEQGQPSRMIKLSRLELIIGRAEDAQITLPDVSVSRHHARLAKGVYGWTLEDLDSANGVVINGQTAKRAHLNEGDRLQIGKFLFIFKEDETEPAAAKPTGDEFPGYPSFPAPPLGATKRLTGADMEKSWRTVHVREHARVVAESDGNRKWQPGNAGLTFGKQGSVPLDGLPMTGTVAELSWNGSAHVLRRRSRWTTLEVNGDAVDDQCALNSGDELIIGKCRFYYDVPDEPGQKDLRR